MEFERDALKELLNIRKHGIPFSESVESFFDPRGIQLLDRKHSKKEGLNERTESESRLDRMEKVLKQLKKKLAA